MKNPAVEIAQEYLKARQYVVTRDGKLKYGPASHDRCFQYIHDAQGQSVDWAVKYEGWKIEPEGATA